MVGTSNESKEQAGRMLELLRRQTSLFGKLAVLSDKQRSLVADGDTDPLLKLLAQRQKLTVELAALGAEMKPLTTAWPQLRGVLPAQDREEADKLIVEVNDRLASLLERDEQDARMLKMRKDRVGEDLAAVRCTRRAMMAYGRAGATNQPCFERVCDES